MLMVAHLSGPLVPSFIGSKWSDCGWELRMMLMVAHLSWDVVLSFIGSK